MDFRVTHFLSGSALITDGNQVIGATTPDNGKIAVVDIAVGTSENATNNAIAGDVIQLYQALDIADPIQKEMRYIKSGKIKKSNIISLKKLEGSTSKNPMVKFIGAAIPTTTYATYASTETTGWGQTNDAGAVAGSSTIDELMTADCSSLNIACGQEFSLTVRAQSARANTISPFGLTKTYTRMVNCCNDCSDTTFKSAYDAVSQVLIDLAADPVMSAYVVPKYIYGWYLTTSGVKAYFKVAYNAATPIDATYVPIGDEVVGEDFALGIVIEGVEQTMWENTADITLFPFRKDAVKIFAQTYVGPMAASNPHNGGTQEPLLVADMCDKGEVYTINFAFPRLTGTEVKHIEHQYATYSQKYGQRFQGVKYNQLVLPSFITTSTTYDLYYIEYSPMVDNSYTSTQDMTQLTIVALPHSAVGNFEELFTDWTGLSWTVLSSTDADITT